MRLAAARALEKIQKGAVSPGYMLIGQDVYWRDRISKALQEAMGLEQSSFGLAEFDLRQDSLDKVLEKAQSLSLLAPRQLIFVKNAQGIVSRRGKGSDASLDQTEDSAVSSPASASRSGDLPSYFQNPNPDSTLVFEMTDVDLESDDWREKEKAKSRVEAFEGILDVVLLNSPSFDEAVEMVRREAAARGQQIASEAAEQLVAAFQRNMAVVLLELEKLCLYQPEKECIEQDDLNRMIGGGGGGTSLGLTDAIGARNATASLDILDALRRSGRYAPLVVAEVVRYLRQLIVLKESQARDPRQAARVLWDAKLGAPQSMMPALVQQARKFTGAELLRGISLAFEADMSFRSSPPDEALVLERFVLALVRPSQPPRTVGNLNVRARL